MNTEKPRKDFEEWMGDGGLSPRAIERNSKGDYILMQTAHAWEVWKAAHTHYAKSAAPVVLPPHPDTTRLQQAVWRLEDLLKDDDPQAWKEARKFLERLKKEQWQEAQPQADALTPAAVAEPVAWTVGGEVTNWSEDFSKYKTQHYVRPVFSTPIKDADARDAERYRWLRDEWLGNEPEAINMERAKGQRGLDAAIDAAIAAAKGE